VSTTGSWSADEIDETGKLIAKYCEGKNIVANLAGGYLESLEAHVDEFTNVCADERPTSPDSLYNLRMELKNHQRVNRREKTLHELKSIAKYQFGENGDKFIPDNVKTKGMYHKRILSNGTQIALLNKDYGLFRLNLAGGEILKELGINIVNIDFDLETNTVFAPGIEKADHKIIPGDEVVVVHDDTVVGVGKAVLTGREMEECSNGIVMKTDEWKVDRRETFLMNIIMEAEGAYTLDSLSGATPNVKPSWTATTVTSDNPFYNKVSNNIYYTLIPANLSDMGALFDFRNVLSNQKYDMYVVTAPALAGDTLATDTLPTRFSVTLYWHDMEGEEKSKVVGEEDGGDISYDSSTRKNTFLVDPKKVHEIHIGTFEFPTCSYNLQEPQVKALVEINVRSSDVTKKIYTRSLRIDQLKLVPHFDSE
jgi:predicted RNA-binding protein (TIGR00451 family)